MYIRRLKRTRERELERVKRNRVCVRERDSKSHLKSARGDCELGCPNGRSAFVFEQIERGGESERVYERNVL